MEHNRYGAGSNYGNKYGNSQNRYNSSDRYRVRSPVKSFRDLEVYQKTIQLSNEITELGFLNEDKFADERREIKETAEKIPRLIAESYGDKFDSKELACKKLTLVITLITNVITRLDILRDKFIENKEVKDALDGLILKYTYQKRKVLNLRKAWNRVFGEKNNERE